MYFREAFNSAGLEKSAFWQALSIARAPSKMSSMSSPIAAAVTKPTSLSTEKRPPTPSLTSKARQLFSCANL